MLDGYDLAGYVDGTSIPPDQMLTTIDPPSTNSVYTKWRRQDKLIYSGLIGTLSPSIQSLVSTTRSAVDMWKTIKNTYASPSWGHMQQLRIQLKQLTKGDKTMEEYMQALTTLFYQLALLGKLLEHEEKIEFILAGLTEDYKSVIDEVERRERPPTIPEVHEKLLSKEAKLMALSVASHTSGPTSAHVASSRPRSHQGKNDTRHTQS